MADTQEQLRQQCLDIAKFIEQEEHGKDDDGEDYTAYDYIAESLSIDYIINDDRTYQGARLCVAFGGPNIYVDTEKKQVQGYWGFDKIEIPYFEDNLGLDDYLEEIATNLFNLKD